jgi:hypothetical protein
VVLGKNLPSFGLHRYKQGLRFLPLDDEGFTLRGDKRQLLYKGRRRSHRFTILGDTSFEYDCILEREPDTNVITLLIEGAEHFDFFRQPDFVKNPFLKGSYAVYKKETLIGEGTGKLCHIHRPLIIDALGRRVWGELAVVGNTLRITIPEQWLAMAKYPVIVDPVVGTTTIGAHRGFYDEEYQEDYYDEDEECWIEFDNIFFPFVCEFSVAINRYQIPQDMLGQVTAYVYLSLHRPYKNPNDTINENFDIQPCLYSDNNNVPFQRLSCNEVFFDDVVNKTNKPDGWRSATFSTNQIINAGSYVWYGMHCCVFNPCFDYGAKFYNCWDDDYIYHGSPPDICPVWNNNINHWVLGTLDIILSMYFNYTPLQYYIRTLTQGVNINESRNLTADYKKTINLLVHGNTVFDGYVTFIRQCWSNVTNSTIVDKSVGILRTIQQQIDVLGEINKGREFITKIIEAVNVEGIAIKSLLLFVRIVSPVYFRDYLLRRFLVAREELKLKSCLTRDLVLDSKIK